MQTRARHFASLVGCAATATTSLICAPAAAQGPALEGGALEEIIVSARRREENVQDVPISITAYSGAQLEQLGVEDLADVAHFSPNMQFDATAAVSGSSVASTIFIRGVGQTDFTLNSDPGVGVYIDGVYLARSVGSLLDLIDVQTVEVLRGPQGTLFGKNTIGGALNITSQRPAKEFGGYVELQGGNFDRRNVKVRLDAPLSSTLLTSLSVASLNEDGYQKRVLQPGSEDLGNVDRIVARGRAVWTPGDVFEADIIADYSRGREQSVSQSVLVIEPATRAPFLPAAAGLIGAGATIRPEFAGQFAGTDILSGRFITSDPRVSFYGGLSRSDFDIFGASATLSWDLGAVSLKSISAYREIDSQFARDSLSSPFVVADTFDDYDQEQWSQEFQVSGDFGDHGNYVAGVFYLSEQGTNSNLVDTSIGALGSGGSVDNQSLAVFAQTNLKFTEHLGATLGARYTDEQKGFSPGFRGGSQRFTSNANGLALGLPPVVPLILDGNYETSSSKTDVTASLQLKIVDDLMTYASYSTGFKAGGFSQRIGPGPGIPAPSFRPEEVAVVEVGLKWLGLQDRVRVNAAVFQTDYDDVQITPLFEGIGPVTRNAGEARIRGAELEFALAPNRSFDLRGGLGWLDTEYRSLTPESQVNVQLDGTTPVLTLDTELAKSPEWSANLAIAGRWQMGAGTFTAGADWSYTSKMFNDVLNSVELERPNLSLYGANLSFVTTDERWTFSARGVNLTDEEYIVAGNAERYFGNIGYTQGTYARPREWWLSVHRQF
jgi:iron complex outermembrane receptor protein